MRGYRKDIEGLRAIAVLLVVFYHYGFAAFGGGFVGVDVFFVISGYVITLLLVDQVGQGQFRFGEFYNRRLRRLVPVFLLVSAATFLLISPFYMDDDYYLFAKSWMAALIGMSNFFFQVEFAEYFAPDAHTVPLLHTWSLAVEEQFYLLWPALLLLAWRYGLQTRMRLFGLLWLLAFAGSVYWAGANPKAAYYLLPARVFEFMLGVGLALYGQRLPQPGRWAAEALALAGLALIAATAVLLSSADHFPGYNALWPTLGAALIIYAGRTQPGTGVGRLLQSRPLVFLGGISYSLYLWHWPPVALMHYQMLDWGLAEKAAVLAAVTGLSWLSYRLVENRFRYRPWPLRTTVLRLLFLPLLLIWALQITIRVADDISFRIPEKNRAIYRVLQQNNSGDAYKRCFKGDARHFETGPACWLGQPGRQPDRILIGDSHAAALAGFVDVLLKDSGQTALLVTQASTPFVTVADASHMFAGRGDKLIRSQALAAYLADKGPTPVLLGAWWHSYLRSREMEGYLANAIAWLVDNGHPVTVLGSVPLLPSAAHAYCLMRRQTDCALTHAEAEESLLRFRLFKERVSALYPQVRWVDPHRPLCDAQRCETVLDGLPLYRDESHLNLLGAQALGRAYLARFGNPLPGVRNETLP